MEELKEKIKMVFFDSDGVLFDVNEYQETNNEIAISSWAVLFDELGIFPKHVRLKNMFIQNKFPSYMEWTDETCEALQKNGLTKRKFLEVISKRPLMSGAEDCLKELKNRGYKTALITGSFQALADRAKKILGFDYAIGHCDLIFDKNEKLKNWRVIPCDFEGKGDYFEKIAKNFGFSPLDCAHVGDEINDIPIFKKAGLAIAFNSTKDEVKKAANIIIDKKDLRKILKYFP